MELEYKTLPFLGCKAGGDGDGSEFEGYCAAFHNCDGHGDIITAGAFASTLADFRENGQIMYNHRELIGVPVEAREDAKGLFVKGRISDTTRGRDCKTLLKDGALRKMSIGYRALARRPCTADDAMAYWKAMGRTPTEEDLANVEQNRGYLSFLQQIKLYEASPVDFPANSEAVITGVKGLSRLSQVKALLGEAKAGRKLSRATHAYLKAVHDSMAPAMDDLKAFLDQHDPDAAADTEAVADEDGKARTTRLTKARAELSLLALSPCYGTPSR